MASRLSDCLVRDGMLPAALVRAATARQAVYGGALDTALLENGVIDEPLLWSTLATATGLPIPDAALFENPDPSAASAFDASWSRRCRAVPVGRRGDTLQVCCAEPIAEPELAEARAALGLELELYVVPEVRLAAARQAVYGEPMSPRLLRVLARLLGAQPVRKWVHALSPAAVERAKAPPATTLAPEAAGRAETLGDLEGELAEAEFDVPSHTFATEPLDIIESRPSRAAIDGDPKRHEEAVVRQAAEEISKAIALPTAPAGAVAAPSTGAGSGSFVGGEKIDTSPGRATTIPPTPSTQSTPSTIDGVPVARPVDADALTARAVADDAEAEDETDHDEDDGYDDDRYEDADAPAWARRNAGALTEEQEDQLCAVAEDLAAAARLAALRVLRSRLARPRVRALADKLIAALKSPPEAAIPAAGALGELRDGLAVPALIEALQGPTALAQTAARALLEIAQQDFGQNRKKWQSWWDSHKNAERVDWLLEGLSHKSPEIRFASSEELRLITGEYFGYHFDLPKREREEARERWQSWWRTEGRARLAERARQMS
ncbi:MAG TPA: hypothetical protein VHJ20_03860 [Polyangia bacterium]|nr:hypothetical protein [Polyangia bacterium]